MVEPVRLLSSCGYVVRAGSMASPFQHCTSSRNHVFEKVRPSPACHHSLCCLSLHATVVFTELWSSAQHEKSTDCVCKRL